MERRTSIVILAIVFLSSALLYLLKPHQPESKDPAGTFSIFFNQVKKLDRKKMETYMSGEFVDKMKSVDTITFCGMLPITLTGVTIVDQGGGEAILLVKGKMPFIGPVERNIRMVRENEKWRVAEILTPDEPLEEEPGEAYPF